MTQTWGEALLAAFKTFIYVNNRLEGNARSTIEAMVGMAA